jgi:hypothetical protein
MRALTIIPLVPRVDQPEGQAALPRLSMSDIMLGMMSGMVMS